MNMFTIGEVARKAGIRTSALRYYESIGLLPMPTRVNGQRRYDARTVGMLAVIRLAQQAGFTIAEIQTLLNGFTPETPPAARWRPLAQAKLAELDEVIARAQQMKSILTTGLDCGCLRPEDCATILAQGPCET